MTQPGVTQPKVDQMPNRHSTAAQNSDFITLEKLPFGPFSSFIPPSLLLILPSFLLSFSCFFIRILPHVKRKSKALWAAQDWAPAERFAETDSSSSKSASQSPLRDGKATNSRPRSQNAWTFCVFNYLGQNESLAFFTTFFSFGNSFTSHFLTGHIILIYKPNSSK